MSNVKNKGRGGQSLFPGIILKISVMLSFAGQAMAHFASTVPYRAILYDQALAGWIPALYGITWNDYINNPQVDTSIDTGIHTVGVLLTLSAVAILFIKRKLWPLAVLPILSSLCLVLLACSHYLDAGLQFAQLFEYSLQALSPILVLAIALYGWRKKWVTAGLCLIALTFAGHGLYAAGAYPVPGHFIDMTMKTMGLREETAKTLLYIAGIADMVAAVLLFPRLTRPYALGYCIIWGLLTTAARYTTYVLPGPMYWLTIEQTLPLILVRTVHFGVPLAYYVYERNKRRYGMAA